MSDAPLVPEDLSDKQLSLGYWFVTHKMQLRHALSIFLFTIDAGMLIFSGYRLVIDTLDAPYRDEMLKELAGPVLNQSARATRVPDELAISNAQILVTQGKYDMLATVKNSNTEYAAHFSYRFVSGSWASPRAEGFILPGEEKFVYQLGITSETRPSGVTLDIIDLRWQRVDRHLIPDWSRFAADHLNFKVADIKYEPTVELSSDKPAIGKTTFAVTNDTGYGYYDLRLLVLMYRGPAVVAINHTTLSSIGPNETKRGEVTWYQDLGAVTQIKVIPEVDITSSAAFVRNQDQ